MLICYLMKNCGYSCQQITRLIRQYRAGRLVRQQRTANGFSRRFTAEDIRLLAAMGERHAAGERAPPDGSARVSVSDSHGSNHDIAIGYSVTDTGNGGGWQCRYRINHIQTAGNPCKNSIAPVV